MISKEGAGGDSDKGTVLVNSGFWAQIKPGTGHFLSCRWVAEQPTAAMNSVPDSECIRAPEGGKSLNTRHFKNPAAPPKG